MRLTCPNCGAQYEVPDEVIPETGRDVQCSNCGDTWFQHHPDHEPEQEDDTAPHPGWDSPEEEQQPEPEPETDADEPADETPEGTAEPAPRAEDDALAEPETTIEDEPDAVDQDGADDDDNEDINEAPQAPPRRELDPSITDILREEASREQEVRAAEASGGLETQPDLGLDSQPDESEQRSQQVRSRMARLRGEPEAPPEPEPEEALPEPDPGSRRNLLPDIDEINSSLSSESSRAEISQAAADEVAPGDMPIKASGGFRRGFMTIVLIVLVLVLLYVMAPTLAENVPALKGPLAAYVDTVNNGRVALNGWLESMSAPPSE